MPLPAMRCSRECSICRPKRGRCRSRARGKVVSKWGILCGMTGGLKRVIWTTRDARLAQPIYDSVEPSAYLTDVPAVPADNLLGFRQSREGIRDRHLASLIPLETEFFQNFPAS